MEDWRRKKIEEVYAKWEKRESGKTQSAEPSRRRPLTDQPVPRPPRQSGSLAGGFSRRKRHQDVQTLQGALAQVKQGFVPSLAVDVSALHAAGNTKYTSVSRCCQTCVPISRGKFYSENAVSVGLRNMLIVDRRKKWGLVGRFFPYTSHVIFTNLDDSHLNDVRKDTFDSKRVKGAIEQCAKAAVENDCADYEKAIKEQESRAHGIVQGMSAGLCKGLIRVLAWLMYWVAGYLFNRIDIQNRHVHMLKAAQERGVPLVFLPCHKSHMDYILMTFILLNTGIRPPRIAAGDNLRLPFISWLVTHLGGFFIKRKLDTAAGKDILYRKCLHEFMEQSLAAGNNMEFFIEGSRSRSGKPNSPKAGLLSVLVDSVKEGVVEDIIIVPVAIAYDKILEKRFVRHELMGGSKRPETVMQVMRGAWAMLTQNTGSVRVDFAQPFSLQEYLSTECVSTDSLMELSNVSRSRSILNMAKCSQRKLVTALSQHVTYDFTHCASLMSTHMVSFLLLNKHREGITYSQLIESYRWLEKAASLKGRSVGFTGEASEAVCYALHYLGDLVEAGGGEKRPKGGVADDQMLLPCLQLPDVFDLLHHGNQVTPMFILESVVASSIYQLVGEELRHNGLDIVEVSREEVLEGAVFLCRLLAREFVFAPPCLGLRTALGDSIDSLINSEVLRVPVSPSSSFGGRRVPHTVLDSEEGDEPGDVMLQVSTESTAVDYLMFLQSILSPFLESYWHTALALLQMEDDTEELEFLRHLQAALVEKAGKGLLSNVESCSMDSLRNAVKSFIDMDLVGYKKGTILQVSDAKQLLHVAEDIMDFKH